MSGSRKIRVVKRDGSEEAFDAYKLAGAMFRAMRQTTGRLYDARQIALAIEVHLNGCGQKRISSAAVFEMTVKVLRRAGLAAAAEAVESYRCQRQDRRQQVRICHEDGQITLWEKGWLSRLAEGSWFLSRRTARILAGDVEEELLARGSSVVSRRDVLDMLNDRVSQYGLADAVPLRQPAGE